MVFAFVAMVGQALTHEVAQKAVEAFGTDSALTHGSVTVAVYDIDADTLKLNSHLLSSSIKLIKNTHYLCSLLLIKIMNR